MKVEGEELIRKFEKITSAAYISLLLRAEERGQVLLSTATSTLPHPFTRGRKAV